MFCAKRQTRNCLEHHNSSNQNKFGPADVKNGGKYGSAILFTTADSQLPAAFIAFPHSWLTSGFQYTMLLLAGCIRNSEECHLLTLLSAHWKMGRWHFSRAADHFPTVHWNDAIFIQLIIICPACGEQTPFYKQLISCLTARKATFIPEQLMSTWAPESFWPGIPGVVDHFHFANPWSTTVFTVLSYYNVLSTHSCG